MFTAFVFLAVQLWMGEASGQNTHAVLKFVSGWFAFFFSFSAYVCQQTQLSGAAEE